MRKDARSTLAVYLVALLWLHGVTPRSGAA